MMKAFLFPLVLIFMMSCTSKQDRVSVTSVRISEIVWELSSDEYDFTSGLMIANPSRYGNAMKYLNNLRKQQEELEHILGNANQLEDVHENSKVLRKIEEFRNILNQIYTILDSSFTISKRLKDQIERIDTLINSEIRSSDDLLLVNIEINFGALLAYRALKL